MNDFNVAVVRVRAQAHGGKYVGPAVAKAPILSTLIDGKPVIADVTIPNQASGTVVTQQGPMTSPYPIIVQPQREPGKYYPTPGTYWLLPPAEGQADVIVTVPVTAPTQVELRVTAFAPQPVFSSVTVTLMPGVSYLTGPGVVVPVKGLYVPSFTAKFNSSAGAVDIQATVQMMCGCPITQQPADAPPSVEPYWPSTEFEVLAIFISTGGPSPAHFPRTVALKCVGTDQFSARLALFPGSYDVWLSAIQPSTMNVGSGSTTVVVP